MIKSMTGFGRSQREFNGKMFTVEIRAVNHRYMEYSSKIPRLYNFIDDKLKKLVSSRVARGKTEVSISYTSMPNDSSVKVSINKPLAKEYIDALRDLGNEYGLSDDITLSSISRFNDIFVEEKQEENEEELQKALLETLDEALDSFIDMRVREGENLKNDISSRLDIIEAEVRKIEEKSPVTVENYRKRLYDKVSELLESKDIDEQRILTEVAIIADKLAVDEETVRLHSHIAQMRQMLEAEEPIGRKMDFLVQEFNREANTIGSKAQDIDIAKIVVNIKSEIEKIREQVQNVE